MVPRFRVFIAVAILTCSAAAACALPPLGLTLVSQQPLYGDLAVVDGVAYASTSEGIYPVDHTGVGSAIVPVAQSGYADLERTTRVVTGTDGHAYFAAEFGTGPHGPIDHLVATYPVVDPTSAIVPGLQLLDADYENFAGLDGLDSSLRALINNGYGQVIEFFPNGTSQFMSLSGTDYLLGINDVAVNGYAVVSAAIPGTLGAAGALLSPDGQIAFLDTFGSFNSIKVGKGGATNVGYWADRNYVVYGDEPAIGIDASLGSVWGGGRTLVSESRFAVIANPEFSREVDRRAFFPGISDEGPDRSVALEALFPELATINYDLVTDMTSQDGQIYLLLTGDDGLWLFAAPDPSLIPEPASLALIAIPVVATLGGGRRLC